MITGILPICKLEIVWHKTKESRNEGTNERGKNERTKERTSQTGLLSVWPCQDTRSRWPQQVQPVSDIGRWFYAERSTLQIWLIYTVWTPASWWSATRRRYTITVIRQKWNLWHTFANTWYLKQWVNEAPVSYDNRWSASSLIIESYTLHCPRR